jgi:phosphoglycerol transferase MdoB-like AlkP superfamily enzyme
MAFRMGFEFDMVSTTYSLLLPVTLLFFSEFFYQKTKLFNRLAFFFTFIFFSLYALVSCADFPYFKQFSSHISKQAFLWNASPDFVFKMIFGNISYYGYLFVFILLVIFHFIVLRKIFASNLKLAEQRQTSWKALVISLVLLAPFMVAGGRGRLSSKTTTHEGLAIVGDNLFVNQIALNPNYTMFRSLLFQKVKNYRIPSDIGESMAFAKSYLHADNKNPDSVTRFQQADSTFRPFNVVIVCLESMSTFKMGAFGTEALTPNFNALIRESVYFDRFFSSGIHTFNGLFSVCAGFPNMLTEHSLRRYTRQPFVTLGNLLKKKNYQTYFGVTHDPVFDNMQGFFTLNGYDNTLSSYNFPHSRVISSTGVPDHELYDLFIKTINTSDQKKPFLGFLMTGSDHGPWAIPEDIPFKPDADSEQKRSTQYADWAIGHFMSEAKKQSWYANTLFVFLGDHGYSTNGVYEMPLSYHNIPFVLHKPNTLKPDTIHSLGYQPDVTSTVAGVLNLSFSNNTFGSNILKEKHPFVYFTADDKIGCISNDGYFFYELISQNTRRLRKYLSLDRTDYYPSRKAKADSMERAAKRMLDAAEYIIRRDYFSY